MKNLLAGKKVSVRTDGQNGEIFSLLEKHIVGARQVLVEPGLKIYQLPDGTILELYGVGSHYPPNIFKNSNMVLSLRVAELKDALLQLVSSGAKLIGNVEDVTKNYAYCHIQLTDGTILGLYQENNNKENSKMADSRFLSEG